MRVSSANWQYCGSGKIQRGSDALQAAVDFGAEVGSQYNQNGAAGILSTV